MRPNTGSRPPVSSLVTLAGHDFGPLLRLQGMLPPNESVSLLLLRGVVDGFLGAPTGKPFPQSSNTLKLTVSLQLYITRSLWTAPAESCAVRRACRWRCTPRASLLATTTKASRVRFRAVAQALQHCVTR